jgi:4a-hydroxytetrahydrobiopterin dehydratase
MQELSPTSGRAEMMVRPVCGERGGRATESGTGAPARMGAKTPRGGQGGGEAMPVDRKKTFSDKEIQDRLAAELPKWRLEDGWIRRNYKTNSWKGTLMVINTVGHLAEAAWHHPDITASYAWVEVRLMSHDAKGVTERDFALAKKIEEVVAWQPGLEPEAALEGTPRGDMRFAYIKYD